MVAQKVRRVVVRVQLRREGEDGRSVTTRQRRVDVSGDARDRPWVLETRALVEERRNRRTEQNLRGPTQVTTTLEAQRIKKGLVGETAFGQTTGDGEDGRKILACGKPTPRFR